jgi:hypothetical protein
MCHRLLLLRLPRNVPLTGHHDIMRMSICMTHVWLIADTCLISRLSSQIIELYVCALVFFRDFADIISCHIGVPCSASCSHRLLVHRNIFVATKFCRQCRQAQRVAKLLLLAVLRPRNTVRSGLAPFLRAQLVRSIFTRSECCHSGYTNEPALEKRDDNWRIGDENSEKGFADRPWAGLRYLKLFSLVQCQSGAGLKCAATATLTVTKRTQRTMPKVITIQLRLNKSSNWTLVLISSLAFHMIYARQYV